MGKGESVKSGERIKAQKVLNRIESGDFDENDIDNLFMRLRAFSFGLRVFREIADFVAHNDNRDRGLAKQSLETTYLRMRFFIEYNSPQRSLDLAQPFPAWIKRLMILQVEKCEKNLLREKFFVSPQTLVKRIKKGFKQEGKSELVTLQKGTLSDETLKALQYVMSFISGRPAFTQEDLIDELVQVLTKNKLEFDREILHAQSDKITICVLLLLHRTQFDIGELKTAHCAVTAEKSCIPFNAKYVDKDGSPVDHREFFGPLSIIGTVQVRNNGRDLGVAHHVMTTNLNADSWCSEKLVRIEPLSEDGPRMPWKKLNLDIDLTIDQEFRLAPVTD